MKKILEVEIKGLDKELKQLGALEKQIIEIRNANKLLRKEKDFDEKTYARNAQTIKVLSDRKRKLEQTTKANIQLGYKEAKSIEGINKALTIEKSKLRELEIGSKAFKTSAKRVKDLENKLRDANQAMGRGRTFVGEYSQGFIQGFAKVATIVGGAVMAFKALQSAIGGSMEAYDKQVKAETALQVALGKTSESLLEQASALQNVTRFGDEETLQADAYLAQMGLEEDQIKRLIPAIQDMAAAKGMDLKQAADLVAKSIASSTNSLSRYGIEIKGAAGSEERLSSALDALNSKFKGQAVAMGNVGMGAFKKFGNAVGDVKEKVGKFITEALTPMMNAFVSILHPAKTLADIEADMNKEYEDQIGKVNGLVFEMTRHNTSQKRKLEIYNELNKISPDIVEGIDKENISTKKLKKNVDLYNKSLLQSLVLKTQQKKIDLINQRRAEAMIQMQKSEIEFGGKIAKDIQTLKSEGYKNQADEIQRMVDAGDSVAKIYAKIHDIFIHMEGRVIPGAKGITQAMVALSGGAAVKYIKASDDMAEADKELNEVMKVKEALEKKLGDNLIKTTEQEKKYTKTIKGKTKVIQKAIEVAKDDDEIDILPEPEEVQSKADDISAIVANMEADIAKNTNDNAEIMQQKYEEMHAIEAEKRQVRINTAWDIEEQFTQALLDMQAQSIEQEFRMKAQAVDRNAKLREKELSDEMKTLDRKKEYGLLTEEQYTAEKDILAQKQQQIENEKQAKIQELKRQQFEQEKKLSIESVLINAAEAAIKIWADTPTIGVPLAEALLAATTIAEIGVIKSKKFPKYAQGGIVGDNRALSGYDSSLIAAHPGEVVLTEQHQAMLGGAPTFRAIGVPGFASGGIVPPAPRPLTAEEVAGMINSVRVVNVATDTTNLSNHVQNIEGIYEL